MSNADALDKMMTERRAADAALIPPDSPLEELLRGTRLRVGRIAIDTMDGVNWRAGISHFNGPSVHQPYPHGDPVEALRAALIEDERMYRDDARRYEAAPKLGDAGLYPSLAPPDEPPLDDMDDILG